jgi:HJR/Mrr/RecB family endonuclease
MGNLPEDIDSSTFITSELRKHASHPGELYLIVMEFERFSLKNELKGPLTENDYRQECRKLMNHGVNYAKFLEIERDYHKYCIFLKRDAPKSSDWNGVIPLNDLFETEITPSDSSKYFEQRFVNYLLENTQDISKMHWRNFERLVTQYFSEKGYHVELGKGTKDGGIDIRIWSKESSKNGPPLIIIQCKRHKNMKIGVELVKSFYADVLYEKAGTGLIATTTSVTSGGQKLIKARGYNIEVAESEEIAKMVKEMWKNPLQNMIAE